MKNLLLFSAFLLCSWTCVLGQETINGDLTGQPTFDRRTSVSYSIDCDASSSDATNDGMEYMVFDIYTTEYEPIQAYTVMGTCEDTYIFLYCYPFDPSHPAQNLIAGDDDDGASSDYASAFLLDDEYYIHPYTHYQLVVTTYSSGEDGTFSLTLLGNAHFMPSQITIEATTNSGGSISPSGMVAVSAFSDETFHMAPDPGYHGLDVIVDGQSIGYRDRYTFTDIVSSHTIHAEFIKSEDPVITSFTADPASGLVPLVVHFAVQANDPDGGDIARYNWDLDGNGTTDQITTEGMLTHRFSIVGEFPVTVTVVDDEGATVTSQPITIAASQLSRIHLPLLTDTMLTKSTKLSPDFHADTWVVNPMNQIASVTLTAKGSDGETLGESVSLIPAGGKMKLSTDVFSGMDVADITAIPDRYVIPMVDVSATNAHMAAYMKLPLTNNLVIPHIAEELNFWDTIAFVTNDYLDLMDILFGSTPIQLDPVHAGLWDVGAIAENTIPDLNPADMWGTFRSHAENPFSSTRMMTGFEMFIKNNGDGAATELTSQGDTRLYIPHIPTETNIFWTGFAFVNNGSEDITASVQFYTDSGEDAGTGEVIVPAGEKVKGLMPELFPDALVGAAWGIVNATGNLVGIEIYGTDEGICGFGLEGLTGTRGVLPLMLAGQNEWTGIALANPNGLEATVTIELVDESGTVIGSSEETIPAYGRLAFVAADYFSRYNLRDTDHIRFHSMHGLIGVAAAGDDARSYMAAIGAGF